MKISTSLLLGSKTFRATIAIFVIANLWTWLRPLVTPDCCLDELTIGFPFPFRIVENGEASFHPLGLTLDLVITLTIAVIATRIACFGGE